MQARNNKSKRSTLIFFLIIILLIFSFALYNHITATPDQSPVDSISWEESLLQTLNNISGTYVWGPILIVLLVGTGLFLTIRLKGLQFRLLGHSLYLALIKRKEEDDTIEGDISHFQALMTALAATVGIGNIAGVATAIAAGGPGALFWMWITGLVGMATKYAEAILAVRFRQKDQRGEMIGGPMYYIWKGLHSKWLGILFASFAAIAAFGIGNMTQSNTVADSLSTTFGVDFWITGLLLFIFVSVVIIGGIKWIARATSTLVPIMIVFYILAATVALIINYDKIGQAFALIFKYSVTSEAAGGGFLGMAVKLAIEKGVSRGIFSNESGLGSAPIAAAAAKTKDPATQALVSMTQTFIDTIIVCTMTGLVIITSDIWLQTNWAVNITQVSDYAGELLSGATLTLGAFSATLPDIAGVNVGTITVTIGIILFAFSTILGWSYYGEKAFEFLFGERLIYLYRIIFCVMVFLGSAIMDFMDSIIGFKIVWTVSDIMNGLMALPNLIALLLLSGIVKEETQKYLENKNRKV